MNVVLDSYGLLGAIGCHRDVFAGIDALVKKQATALLTAQLKHKSLDLHFFHAIVAAVGTEPFELFLDTADDRLMKAIAKKIDQHAAVSKSDDDDQLRSHLIDLAARRIEPVIKPGKTSGGSKKSATKSGKTVSSAPSQQHAIATKPPGRR